MERITITTWCGIGIGSAALAVVSKALLTTVSSDDGRVRSALDSIGQSATLRQVLGDSEPYRTRWPWARLGLGADGSDTINFAMRCENGTASVSTTASAVMLDCPWNQQRYTLTRSGEAVVSDPIAAPIPHSTSSDNVRLVGNASVLVATGLGMLALRRFNGRGGFTGMRLIRTVRAHPVVQEILGPDVRTNGRMVGRISAAVVNVRIPLQGSKSRGAVVLQGVRIPHGSEPSSSAWKYTYAAVEDGRSRRTMLQL